MSLCKPTPKFKSTLDNLYYNALVLDGDSSRLRLESRCLPDVRDGEVLLRVEACTLSPGDVWLGAHVWQSAASRVPGHEAIGRVITYGPHVDESVTMGGRYAVAWQSEPCAGGQTCRCYDAAQCAKRRLAGFTSEGGCAELILVRASCLIRVPATVCPGVLLPLLCPATSLFMDLIARQPAPRTIAFLGLDAAGLLGISLATKHNLTSVALQCPPLLSAQARLMGVWDVCDSPAELQYFQQTHGVIDVVVVAATMLASSNHFLLEAQQYLSSAVVVVLPPQSSLSPRSACEAAPRPHSNSPSHLSSSPNSVDQMSTDSQPNSDSNLLSRESFPHAVPGGTGSNSPPSRDSPEPSESGSNNESESCSGCFSGENASANGQEQSSSSCPGQENATHPQATHSTNASESGNSRSDACSGCFSGVGAVPSMDPNHHTHSGQGSESLSNGGQSPNSGDQSPRARSGSDGNSGNHSEGGDSDRSDACSGCFSVTGGCRLCAGDCNPSHPSRGNHLVHNSDSAGSQLSGPNSPGSAKQEQFTSLFDTSAQMETDLSDETRWQQGPTQRVPLGDGAAGQKTKQGIWMQDSANGLSQDRKRARVAVVHDGSVVHWPACCPMGLHARRPLLTGAAASSSGSLPQDNTVTLPPFMPAPPPALLPSPAELQALATQSSEPAQLEASSGVLAVRKFVRLPHVVAEFKKLMDAQRPFLLHCVFVS